jgi:ribosomal protein S2
VGEKFPDKSMEMAEKTRKEFSMASISMKALLEAGVHFGHQTNK